MPLIERLALFWKCALCGGEWFAKDPDRRPVKCRYCASDDWFEGKGKVKRKIVKMVRTVGHKQIVIQESGEAALRQIKRIEKDLRRKP